MIEFSDQNYDSIMSMPSTRRHRYVMKKLDSEKRKAKQMESHAGRMKRR